MFHAKSIPCRWSLASSAFLFIAACVLIAGRRIFFAGRSRLGVSGRVSLLQVGSSIERFPILHVASFPRRSSSVIRRSEKSMCFGASIVFAGRV